MRIRLLSIRNFRGIRELDWALPDKSLVCLIGRGDSTKSTILDALRCAFYPQWNLIFDDADFYQCKPGAGLTIDVVLGDIPDEFRGLEAYGQWLCGWSKTDLERHDEPGEGLEDALRVRLSVSDNLEPSWRVIRKDKDEGVPFRQNDRAKAGVILLGAFSDRHLTWSRGSVLSRLTNSEDICASLADAGRAAKAALEGRREADLGKFDEVARTAESTARSLGVGVTSSYKAHLDSGSINIRAGSLALHDGEMPLRQLGLGSRRMLTAGLQKETRRAPHITLFDEVEIGLEPHRLTRLLEYLKADSTGQYFLTSHSPVVLRELTVDDLHIVHYRDGRPEIVAAAQPGIVDTVQGKIRTGAEAFLAPKIIVCEGATEAGFLRGLDIYHWTPKGLRSFAYQGVAPFDAHTGSQVRQSASSLVRLAYDVAVFADDDAADQFSAADATALAEQGVFVTRWAGSTCIEERVAQDLTWAGVKAMFGAACTIRDSSPAVIDQIQSKFGCGFNRDPAAWSDCPRLRLAIGKAAKASGWFKRQSWACEWAKAISPYLDDALIAGTDLVRKLNALRQWIDRA